MRKVNNKGSVLSSALIVMLIAIGIFGLLSYMSAKNHQKSLEIHTKRQAYLYSVSVVDVISEEVMENNALFIPGNEPLVISDLSFRFSQEERSLDFDTTATIEKKDELIEIVATTIYKEQESTVKLTLIQENGKYRRVGYTSEDDSYEVHYVEE